VRIEGTKRFAAPPERVWDALVDPELLADFLPGIESLEVHDESHWSAGMRLPHSPLSLTLEFELRDRRRPDHALLHAHGKRLGASAKVDTSFDLQAADGATDMAWAADIAFGGALGPLGGVLRPLAQQHAERFLDRLEQRLRDQ
jgi:carbon monoxide dehydrogenase subunit G